MRAGARVLLCATLVRGARCMLTCEVAAEAEFDRALWRERPAAAAGAPTAECRHSVVPMEPAQLERG